jgi:hypothetical protein
VRNKKGLQKRRRGISYKQQKEGRLHLVGNILLRNFLLKQVIEGKEKERTEVTGRRGRRRKQLQDNHKGKRGYWELEGAWGGVVVKALRY